MPRHWDDLELLRTIDRLEQESPLDYLAFASLLMRRLDDAEERLGQAQGAATAASSAATGTELR